jgi:zinc D-Ala-D-Ala carboxypeptidase
MTTVSVRRGDTLSEIAQRQGISLASLRRANPGVNPRALQIGQRLQLPGSRDAFDSGRRNVAGRDDSFVASNRTPAGRSPYPNGRIPSSALTNVGGGHKLYGDAARAYMQMRDAARRDGVNLRLTDSYRSYAAQVDVARRKGIYGVRQPNGRLGLAARPGTSNHGLGRAVDVNLDASPGASRWLRENAARFGFRTIPREPWHWEYRG